MPATPGCFVASSTSADNPGPVSRTAKRTALASEQRIGEKQNGREWRAEIVRHLCQQLHFGHRLTTAVPQCARADCGVNAIDGVQDANDLARVHRLLGGAHELNQRVTNVL